MKRIIIFIYAIMMTFIISAQAPNAFKYQTVVRDQFNQILANQSVGFKISILQTTATGTAVYVETHNAATNAVGIVNLEIGKGTPVSGNITTINWGTNVYYLKIEIDPNGGTAYTHMGTSQLLSVPYALYASSSGGGGGGVTGTGAANKLAFWTGTSALSSNTNLHWDNTNDRLGVGTTAPNTKLMINAATGDALRVQIAGNTKMFVGDNGGTTLGIYSSGSPTNGLFVNGQTIIGVPNGTAGTLYQKNAKLQVQTHTRYAGYFSTDSVSSISYAIYAKHTAASASDVRALRGEAVAAPGWGYGIDSRGGYKGVYGFADATTYTGPAYGVEGYASGSAGTRYGVYGSTGGTASTRYGVYCSGNGAYTGSWSSVSDLKFKKNIQPMTNSLSKILKLEPRTFEMRTEEYEIMNFNEGKQFGFIAQDLHQIFPELVTHGVHPGAEKGKDIEYLGVDYISMIPVLVQAIQEQQKIIEAQQQQIDELRSLINK